MAGLTPDAKRVLGERSAVDIALSASSDRIKMLEEAINDEQDAIEVYEKLRTYFSGDEYRTIGRIREDEIKHRDMLRFIRGKLVRG